jgi:hypothetical protein
MGTILFVAANNELQLCMEMVREIQINLVSKKLALLTLNIGHKFMHCIQLSLHPLKVAAMV